MDKNITVDGRTYPIQGDTLIIDRSITDIECNQIAKMIEETRPDIKAVYIEGGLTVTTTWDVDALTCEQGSDKTLSELTKEYIEDGRGVKKSN